MLSKRHEYWHWLDHTTTYADFKKEMWSNSAFGLRVLPWPNDPESVGSDVDSWLLRKTSPRGPRAQGVGVQPKWCQCPRGLRRCKSNPVRTRALITLGETAGNASLPTAGNRDFLESKPCGFSTSRSSVLSALLSNDSEGAGGNRFGTDACRRCDTRNGVSIKAD